MNSTETVLRFLAFLAQVQGMFRQVHLIAEKSPILCDVSTDVIPSLGAASNYADEGVTISIALNGWFVKPPDSEREAMGMSVLLRHCDGVWIAEAEVGWTGREIGWDPFDSKETEATSIEEIMDKAPPLVEWMGTRFRKELEMLELALPNT
jgi:hypothetical protein